MEVLQLPLVSDDGRFIGKRVAIVCAGSPVSGGGGAERFYDGLKRGFEALGCSVDYVSVEADEPSVERILSNYESAAERDLSDFDIVVSSKVPTYAVRHPNHVLYLNHAVRIFDDMFLERFDPPKPEDYQNRALIHQSDLNALMAVRALFAQGYEIARRLKRWRGITAEVMHPPLPLDTFLSMPTPGEHFLIAGRMHPWKRFDLLIKSFRLARGSMRLLIAGEGEQSEHLRALAADDERIQFIGRVSDEHLLNLYARAVAVPFIPLREDYGYVTIEAFASACPVLTCTDSGEPSHIVRNYETGLVVNPDPASIAKALEWFWENRDEARRMGERGRSLVNRMDWRATAFALACAATEERHSVDPKLTTTAVIDMQPIDPAVGGGRLRLLGLYHNLGKQFDGQYVGTYDWPGQQYRYHKLGPSLHELDVPLSSAHFSAARELQRQANGKNVIDLAFSQQAHLSPEYVAAALNACEGAEVVIFSHPWAFPLVEQQLRHNQVVIYDAHNVEGFLRAQFLDSSHEVEREVLNHVIEDELMCGRRADWILACSHEDLLRFHRLYGFTPEKIRVVPNGVMVKLRPAPSAEEKAAAKRSFELGDGLVGVFMGSGYGPNLDAARFISEQVARACPDITFVIIGGVGIELDNTPANLVVTGIVSDSDRDRWLSAADFAINPMTSGSGTNIKMFDFMAMALPVITTEIGARGIETGARQAYRIVKPDVREIAQAIDALGNATERHKLGIEARQCVEENYAWENISELLGKFIEMRVALAGQPRPKYTVVIPSYERPEQLSSLMLALSKQIERDFEVVVVDQSAQPWHGSKRSWGFPLFYYNSPIKGAVRARNTGAMLAQGQIIAFIDDDCLPEPEWLLNANQYFADNDVVGIEGLIRSDHHDDPDWRPVSNVGFEGIGFMTANLFVRSAAFQYIGGLDLQFDKPHFREDTDLGWRLLDVGKMPYGKDVVVFHPAQPRALERESKAERNKFFVKDARLWQKHPKRYRELFMAEEHYLYTPEFKKYLIEGFEDIGLGVGDMPAWMRKALNV